MASHLRPCSNAEDLQRKITILGKKKERKRVQRNRNGTIIATPRCIPYALPHPSRHRLKPLLVRLEIFSFSASSLAYRFDEQQRKGGYELRTRLFSKITPRQCYNMKWHTLITHRKLCQITKENITSRQQAGIM